MKDDNDNLNQLGSDSDTDINTPSIPAETEPDTTNTNDNEALPYDMTGGPSDDEPEVDSPLDDSDTETETPLGDGDTNTEASESSTSSFGQDSRDSSDKSSRSSSATSNKKTSNQSTDMRRDSFDPIDSSQPAASMDTSESTQLPDFMAPAPAPQKQKRGGKVVLTIIIFILLIALGGFVYWYYYLQPADTDTATVDTEPKAQVQTSLSYTDVIKDLKSNTPEKVADSFPTAIAFTTDNEGAPLYKLSGNDFYMAASGESKAVYVQSDGDKKIDIEKDGIDVDDKYIESEKPITDAFVTYFTENDFKEVQTYDRDLPLLFTVYTNDQTVCSVSSGEYPASVSCAPMANYTRDQAKLSAMYPAFQKATKNKDTTVAFSIISTKTNQKLGYENAQVGVGDVRSKVGGSAALFYKKVDDKNWAYLDDINNAVECDVYDTYAKQAAFEGDPCGDGKTVTVTADKPKKMKAL